MHILDSSLLNAESDGLASGPGSGGQVNNTSAEDVLTCDVHVIGGDATRIYAADFKDHRSMPDMK